jgi:hypothetical protein
VSADLHAAKAALKKHERSHAADAAERKHEAEGLAAAAAAAKTQLAQVREAGRALAAREQAKLAALGQELGAMDQKLAATHAATLAKVNADAAAAKTRIVAQSTAKAREHEEELKKLKAAAAAAKVANEKEIEALKAKLEAQATQNSILQCVPMERVAYAIDFSGSMSSSGAYSKASTYLRKALDIQMQLQTAAGKTQDVGVVCFASSPQYVVSQHLQAATLGHIQALSSGLPHSPDGGTSVEKGILAAARMVPQPQQIFVLTDCCDSISAARIRAQGYAGEVHLRYAETGHNQGDVAGMRGEIAQLGGTVRTCSMRP